MTNSDGIFSETTRQSFRNAMLLLNVDGEPTLEEWRTASAMVQAASSLMVATSAHNLSDINIALSEMAGNVNDATNLTATLAENSDWFERHLASISRVLKEVSENTEPF